jgi:predicted dehydrogenase
MDKIAAIAVAGAGLIGRRHIEAVHAAASSARLHSIVDPAPVCRALAEELGVPWYPSLETMFDADKPDGVILATPNQLHLAGGMACISAGVAALIEKPFATDVAAGEEMADAAEAAGVVLMTGHHRRHNPLMRRARQEIDNGSIGEIVSVHATTWFYKPDDYFEAEWRCKPGAGPVFLNLIHDIDLLHYLCGPVEMVSAVESNAVRGNAVEETAVILLKFASGALGTINVSDTIVSPWSWELTARENPAYPPTTEACCLIGGTHGSLELPGLRLWRNRQTRSWWEPIDATKVNFGFDDPLVLQVRQFVAAIQGIEAPLVSGRDGLEALRVIKAVKQAAATGNSVKISRERVELGK